MKIILHILLYLLTFFAYLGAVGWAIEQGSAKMSGDKEEYEIGRAHV